MVAKIIFSMKKCFLLFAVTAALVACGGGNEQPKQAPGTTVADPVVQQGLDLITKADCRTCHKDDSLLIGPAYKDIANKYIASDSMVSHLADKIIHGGTGVWGNVPMTPHPTLAKPDAEIMLRYIFSLKTN
jgi:cytochrome c